MCDPIHRLKSMDPSFRNAMAILIFSRNCNRIAMEINMFMYYADKRYASCVA